MAKQLINQKNILKICSGRLKRSKWDLTIRLSEAIKNDELITLGSSQALRFIDEIVGRDNNEEEINKLKNKINKLKNNKNSKENRKALSLLYKDINNSKYTPEYVSVIVESMADFDKMNSRNKFKINGVNYVRLLGTTGGIKNRTIVYVAETIYEELNSRIDNGRNKEVPIIPAKLEAYRALACSNSIPVTNTHNVIVVPDAVTKFTENVIKISDSDLNSNRPVLQYADNEEMEMDCSDGFGMISPEMSKQWAKDIKEDYLPSGYCIRNSFCKGMVFTFDFKEFAEKIAKNNIVVDVWGHEKNIMEADMILTESMLKLWSSYDSIEHYFENCDKNNYSFAITKVTPEVLDEQRGTNYQYLQSYELTDKDIEDLAQPTVQAVKSSLGGEYGQTLLFLRGTELTSQNAFKGESDYIQGLMIEPKLINDTFIKNKILNMREKRIRQAKTGILDVKGNYTLISGDVYSLCQSMFNMKITGLLKANEIYNKFWLDKKQEEVVIFRSPMSCHNNIKKVSISHCKEAEYWFRYMNNVTILNSWDNITQALNGADMDGDIIFSTNNEVLLKNTRDTRAIICQQNTANKVIVTEKDLIQSNKDGFGDGIGKTTNRISAMYELLPLFNEDSKEYKELQYRIMCGQHYQQCEIDKIKGIKSNPMPKEWYEARMCKSNKEGDSEDEEINSFNRSIVVDKKPYFFIYIYPELKKKYVKFKKDMEESSILRLNKSIEEVLDNPKTKEELRMVECYNYNNPVFEYNSTMNRICRYIEKELNVTELKEVEEEFDYNILKSDVEYSKTAYNKVKAIYKEYNERSKFFMSSNKYMREKENRESIRQLFREEFERKCYEECSNSEILCNILIDICYSSNKGKQFVWDICGEQIISNLLKKNNNIINYVCRDENGDIEFNGERFSMAQVEYEI